MIVLDEVLKLYNRGLSVFPVSNDSKIPLVKWSKYQEVLPTEQEVVTWFSENNRSVGVATGSTSNLFLLDFDFQKHPEAKEFHDTKTFPRTWSEKTKSNGLHIYFKWDSRLDSKQTNTASLLWSGVDTKGTGGYSKICPSAGYEWIVAPHMSSLAEVPQWLVDLLPDKGRREIGAGVIKTISEIKEGNRDNSFASLAGGLRARGYSVEEMYTLLEPKAKELSFPLEDLLRVCNSIGRYPTNVPEDETKLLTNHSIASFLSDTKQVPFIIPNILGENTINIWAGLAESRKSWVLLELGISLASGSLWLSKFPCQKRKVLILDQERPKAEMQRRIRAIALGKNIDLRDLEGYLFPKKTSFFLNLDQSYEKFVRLIENARPDIVLIDSLKTIQTGDITNNQIMQMFFERIKSIREKYNVTFVILHHENKGAFERNREKREITAENIEGAGSINQVPEGISVIVSHDDDSSFFYHVKNSYGKKLAPFLIRVLDIKPDSSEIRVEAF